jgi:hypothetical protein
LTEINLPFGQKYGNLQWLENFEDTLWWVHLALLESLPVDWTLIPCSQTLRICMARWTRTKPGLLRIVVIFVMTHLV